MKTRRVVVVAVLSFLGLMAFAPEAGAQPTPLFQCQPLAAGSYFLTKNIVTPGGDCFTLLDSGISLNFGGFFIQGNGTGAGVTDGGAALSNISIQNGRITNFAVGIELGSSADNQIGAMRVIGNTLVGMNVGSGSHLADNVVGISGAGDGIHVACPSLLIENIVTVVTAPGGTSLVESGKGCKEFNNVF
jgi:hypothetical protein